MMVLARLHVDRLDEVQAAEVVVEGLAVVVVFLRVELHDAIVGFVELTA